MVGVNLDAEAGAAAEPEQGVREPAVYEAGRCGGDSGLCKGLGQAGGYLRLEVGAHEHAVALQFLLVAAAVLEAAAPALQHLQAEVGRTEGAAYAQQVLGGRRRTGGQCGRDRSAGRHAYCEAVA